MGGPDFTLATPAKETMTLLDLYTPAGVLPNSAPLRLAAKRLTALGYQVRTDDSALAKHQRFGGDDATRLKALHRVAEHSPSVAMATRGGYGITRLLDGIDWRLLAHSVERGTRWVGHSDLTALQIGLLAHTGAGSWAGPMAADDFGRTIDPEADNAAELTEDYEITRDCFVEAMAGELEAVGFRTEAGHDGLSVRGPLWGGNLEMLCSMLGTRHWPAPKLLDGGILFVEDVNAHPYRIERCLLQLQQAGVLARQKAVLLGTFSAWKPSPLDRGYSLKSVWQRLRATVDVPLLTGLPFGHVQPKLTLPVGRRVQVLVDGREVLVGW
ncbi:MAG: LD-carboxypeptidase [Rubrivivax sp.]